MIKMTKINDLIRQAYINSLVLFLKTYYLLKSYLLYQILICYRKSSSFRLYYLLFIFYIELLGIKNIAINYVIFLFIN